MTDIQVSVVVESADAGKVIEVDISRDDCENICALGHVLGETHGPVAQVAQGVESGMRAVLAAAPMTPGLQLTVPFTVMAAANVVGICSTVTFLKPTGPQWDWVENVVHGIGQALEASSIRTQILINGESVFSTLGLGELKVNAMQLSREGLKRLTRLSVDPTPRGRVRRVYHNVDLTDQDLVRSIEERNDRREVTFLLRMEYERRLKQRGL